MVSLSFESNLVSQVNYLFPSSSYSIMETSISWSFSIIQWYNHILFHNCDLMSIFSSDWDMFRLTYFHCLVYRFFYHCIDNGGMEIIVFFVAVKDTLMWINSFLSINLPLAFSSTMFVGFHSLSSMPISTFSIAMYILTSSHLWDWGLESLILPIHVWNILLI